MSNSYERDQVVQIISSVISKVEHVEEVSREAIFKELTDLQDIIEESRKEIGIARPMDINDKDIPIATDELDAVVESTAQATGTIMDACDVISEKAMAVGGENGDALMEQVTKIYEACSFQDITGQRITKVVRTLKSIEDKVGKLVSVLGQKLPGFPDEVSGDDMRTGDAALLNGPQMKDQAISQDEIDKLLEEFD